MAAHLDLEEQEQLAELKHFWKTWGNLISWVLIAVLGSYAAWNGWQYWQRNQAAKASALYDEVEKAVLSQDVARVERSVADMKDKFGSTLYAHQAGLVAASVLSEKDKSEQARVLLAWVAADAPEAALREIELDGIDLVFSDIVMPGKMDGLGLAHHLREIRPGLPIEAPQGYFAAVDELTAAGLPGWQGPPVGAPPVTATWTL